MKFIERVFWGHLFAATAFLAAGFVLAPEIENGNYFKWTFLTVTLLLGLAWFAVQQRKTQGYEGLLLFGYGILAMIGLFGRTPAWPMMFAITASLGAWDLHTFLQRLNRADRVEYESGLGKAHLRRLAGVEISGLFLGLVAITIHPRVSFWWMGALALIAVIGISRLIARIRKETE